ncbi:MAG: hypothetical protein V3U71_07440 [Cocleimonas sp.]
MAKKPNETKTIRIQVSLDKMSADILEDIASFGPLGKTKTEVATNIIQEWIRKKSLKELEEMKKLMDR